MTMRIEDITNVAEAIEYGDDLFVRMGDDDNVAEERAEGDAWYLHVCTLLDTDDLWLFRTHGPARPTADPSVTRARAPLWHRLRMLHLIAQG